MNSARLDERVKEIKNYLRESVKDRLTHLDSFHSNRRPRLSTSSP